MGTAYTADSVRGVTPMAINYIFLVKQMEN